MLYFLSAGVFGDLSESTPVQGTVLGTRTVEAGLQVSLLACVFEHLVSDEGCCFGRGKTFKDRGLR